MSPLKALWKDIRASKRLGAGVLNRHFALMSGQDVAQVNVRGYGPIWVRTKGSDSAVLNQVLAGREYDLSRFPQHKRILAALNDIRARGKRPVIIDAGANIGVSAIYFAKHYPDAVVVAVEPDPQNLDIARRNLNPVANIVLAEAAIGARGGKVNAIALDNGGYATRTERSEDGAIPVLSIDEAKTLAGENAELLFVKVDIEGFEADLFTENLGWLDETKALLVEMHDWMLPGQHSSRALQRAMWSRDFEVLIRGETLMFVR
jgi:FkbM family methyltransferase